MDRSEDPPTPQGHSPWMAPVLPMNARSTSNPPFLHATSIAGSRIHAQYGNSPNFSTSSQQIERRSNAPAFAAAADQCHDGRVQDHTSQSGVPQAFVPGQTNSGMGIIDMESIPRTYHANSQLHPQSRLGSFSSVHDIHVSDAGNTSEVAARQPMGYHGRSSYVGSRLNDGPHSLEQPHPVAHQSRQLLPFEGQLMQPLDQPQPLLATHLNTVPTHHIHGQYQAVPDAVPPAVWSIQSQPLGIQGMQTLPNYNGLYDFLLEIKTDDDDPSMQLPSARLETL